MICHISEMKGYVRMKLELGHLVHIMSPKKHFFHNPLTFNLFILSV